MYDSGERDCEPDSENFRNEMAHVYFRPIKENNGWRSFNVTLPVIEQNGLYQLIGSGNEVDKSKLAMGISKQ